MKNIKTFTTFLIFLIKINEAFAMNYLGLEVGQGKMSNEEIADHNVNLKNTALRASYGFHFRYFELEAFYSQGEGSGEIIHDGKEADLLKKEASYGLKTFFYLNKMFFLSMGYSYYDMDFEVDGDLSAVQQEGALSAYGLKDSASAEGVTFGTGLIFHAGRHFKPYLYLEQKNYNLSNSTETIFSVGFKMYVSSPFGSIGRI